MNIILRRISFCRFVVNSTKRMMAEASASTTQPNEKTSIFTQKRNSLTGDTEWDVKGEDYDYHQEIARSAFADMLHDRERNKKYEKALQLAIEKMHKAAKEANVLDIGTGTGLLSIMAVRCGADSVVACEAFKPMADCCEKILEQNGVRDRVTLIKKRSTDLEVGPEKDMKVKANILVTEVFDTELIGEGALATFSHAHQNLLEADCIVVPDSAIMYAQVVECPTMKNWHTLLDVVDDETENTVLKVPEKIKNCPGHAAVHDLQLSQVQRHHFIELSEPVLVFYFDWSGKTPIDMKRVVKQQFNAYSPGDAHMVFVWWELSMDQQGKIVLSCAPWWCHPEGNPSSERPADALPWRDHWMQSIYYLPSPRYIEQFSEQTLVCCHDEYSLWFFLEDDNNKQTSYQRPVCDCGVHLTFSRTHLASLNDYARTRELLNRLKFVMQNKSDAVVLDLNGSSIFGLLAAKIGAKKVYIHETKKWIFDFLTEYIKANEIENCEIVSEVSDEILAAAKIITCDPSFSNALLPWENMRIAQELWKFKGKLREDVAIIPDACEIWAMPVEFKDLHKIRIPLGKCEGVDMSAFDELLEKSRSISDALIEPQPLWEYPTKCRGEPRVLLKVDFYNLKKNYASHETYQIASSSEKDDFPINGFVLWTSWNVGQKSLSMGAVEPYLGGFVYWDPHSKQAVQILKKTHVMSSTDCWKAQVVYDLALGEFEVYLNLAAGESEVVR